MGIIWTIVIGFVAGVSAKFLMPGNNLPAPLVLTTILGIVGAFVASCLGQALGWYAPKEGAGLIGADDGANISLSGESSPSGADKAARGAVLPRRLALP